MGTQGVTCNAEKKMTGWDPIKRSISTFTNIKLPLTSFGKSFDAFLELACSVLLTGQKEILLFEVAGPSFMFVSFSEDECQYLSLFWAFWLTFWGVQIELSPKIRNMSLEYKSFWGIKHVLLFPPCLLLVNYLFKASQTHQIKSSKHSDK